jgi:hypothetical protein
MQFGAGRSSLTESVPPFTPLLENPDRLWRGGMPLRNRIV